MKTKTFTLIKIIVAVISLMVYKQSQSQVNEEWVRRYNGPGNSGDKAYSAALDAAGNIYVTGYTINKYTNCLTIKYNSSGVQQWAQTYNGTGNNIDEGRAIVIDVSGNVYVAGFSAGFGTADDYLIAKYNSAGVEQWVRSYNGPLSFIDRATGIAVAPSGNVYVTGKSGGSTGNDYATVKFNSSGIQVWARRYNGDDNLVDEANAIAIDASENVYVTGISNYSTTGGDYVTIKYDSTGSFQWLQRYNGTASIIDEARAIGIDGSGFIYVTGPSRGSGTGDDFVTIKYSSAGVQQWLHRYNAPENARDEAHALNIDASGNVIVTGYSYISGSNYDTKTIKYNSSGVVQWVKSYNGPGNEFDEGSSITTDAALNVYVTGRSGGYFTNLDYATIKYDHAGVQKWVQRYNGLDSGQDESTSIAVDADGNVFVTGGSNGTGSSSDFATIKYSQTIGINVISNEVPEYFYLSQNYPNPFNPVTNLEFGIALASRSGDLGFVSLKIYDITGKEVSTLVNEKLSAGSYEVEFDASGLPSGQYFYRLISGNFIETKKMILLK